jgi:YggT family protein
VLNVVFRILSAILSVYGLLILLRVLVGWVSPHIYGKPWDLLCAVVDPYLSLFRRMKFLRRGTIDYSSLLAIILLVIASNLFWALGIGGRITIGLMLAVTVSAVWNGVWIIFLFFIICGILRIIPIVFHGIGGYPIWKALDLLIFPVVSWVTRLFRLRTRSGYTQALLLTLGLLFVMWLLGELVFRQLISLFKSLPM